MLTEFGRVRRFPYFCASCGSFHAPGACRTIPGIPREESPLRALIAGFPDAPRQLTEAAPGTATAEARRVALALVAALESGAHVTAADGAVTLLFAAPGGTLFLTVAANGGLKASMQVGGER